MKKNRQLVPCIGCGSLVWRVASMRCRKTFCSNSCYGEWLKTQVGPLCHNWNGGRSERRCLTCGDRFQFRPGRKVAKFCSRSCASRARVGELAANWRGIDYKNTVKAYRRAKQFERTCRQKVSGSFTEAEWIACKSEYGNTCASCGKPEPVVRLTRDHIVPLILGGLNTIENIQPLCKSCNGKKFRRIIFFREGFEITDIELVPRELMRPNRFRIEAAISSGVRVIPGLEIYQKA